MKPVIMFAVALGASIAFVPAAQAQSSQPVPDTDASGSGNLSDKLDQSGGVIHPKGNVDPGMAKPAPTPNPGSGVIVPPGTNGAPGPQAK